MSVSIFESIPDKILFKFIKTIMEDVDFEILDSSQDYNLRDGLEEAESTFGIRGNDTELDCDYIYNVWKLNKDLFEEDRLTANLNRPKLNDVTFHWVVWQTQWVRETYNHHIKTYGSERDDVKNYIDGLASDGNLSVWDGDMIDGDVYETETTDDSIDTDTIDFL